MSTEAKADVEEPVPKEEGIEPANEETPLLAGGSQRASGEGEEEGEEEEEEWEEKLEEVQLLKMPKLGEWDEDVVRFVTVSEIFFDLVFVAACAKFTHGVRLGKFIWHDFFQYFLVTLLFWKFFTEYCSIWDSGDMMEKLSTLLYGGGVIGLCIFSDGGVDNDHATGFGWVCFYISCLQWLLLYRSCNGIYLRIKQNPMGNTRYHQIESKEHAQKNLQLVCIILFGVYSACFGGEGVGQQLTRRIIMWVIIAIKIIGELTLQAMYEEEAHRKYHVHHLCERFEAITLILLGETCLGITPDPPSHSQAFEFLCLAYVIMFFYKIFRFDVEEYEGPDHAIFAGGFYKCFWTYFTILEGLGIACIGGGLGQIIEKAMANFEAEGPGRRLEEINGPVGIQMFFVGTSLALFSNFFSRFFHNPEVEDFDGAVCLYWVQLALLFVCSSLWACLCTFLWDINDFDCAIPSMWVYAAILFFLNILFYMDEILQYRYIVRVLTEKGKL